MGSVCHCLPVATVSLSPSLSNIYMKVQAAMLCAGRRYATSMGTGKDVRPKQEEGRCGRERQSKRGGQGGKAIQGRRAKGRKVGKREGIVMGGRKVVQVGRQTACKKWHTYIGRKRVVEQAERWWCVQGGDTQQLWNILSWNII